MKKLKQLIPLLLAMTIISACSTKVSYVNPQSVNTTSLDFNSTDLQSIAAKMTDSLLHFPAIIALTQNKRPVIFVNKVSNQTDQVINTASIDNMIQTHLVQSGKFRFVDMTTVKAVRKQLLYQNESGMVDPSKAIAFGKQVGARYMLTGSIATITQRNSSVTDVYYLFTMKLLDLKTGIVEWQDQKQLRKQAKKTLFGW